MVFVRQLYATSPVCRPRPGDIAGALQVVKGSDDASYRARVLADIAAALAATEAQQH